MLPFEAQDISMQIQSSVSAYLSEDQASEDVFEDRREDDLLEFLTTAAAGIQPSEGAIVVPSYWLIAGGEAL